MGNEHSHHSHKHAEDKGAAKKPPQQQQQQPAKKAKPSAAEVAALAQSYDVVISSTPGDGELTTFLKSQLEAASIPVYSDSSETDEAAKLVGKVLVDAKTLVIVVGEETSKSGLCQDQVSLAYISNKTIIVAAKKGKDTLITGFSVGMKLTLQSLSWTVFDKDEERDAVGRQFVQMVQENLNKPVIETADVVVTASLESQPTGFHHQRRINTKVRAQSTLKSEGEQGPLNTFWDRNFRSEEEVPWYRFQQAFLSDYEAQLSGLFTQENMPWLLKTLQKDIFGGAENISKGHFMQIRGDSPDKNAFWRSVSQIAIEKFNMQEVFNMESSVRLTAIEKLAQFGSAPVIEALIKLLEDQDPNVRAVAAISLGRTGVSDENVVDDLIKLLKDPDRIVRQSACLSLGHMKAIKAIPDIGNIWRNDFISVVRNAARTALENMKIPEAERVLKVTKVLEEEIATLEGQHAAV